MHRKAYVACNFNCYTETEELSMSQAITYTAKVVIPWKWCKTKWPLLQCTDHQ